VVDLDKLAYAAHLRDSGSTIAEIVTKTGVTRSSLYRHLPPRPPETAHRRRHQRTAATSQYRARAGPEPA